MKVRTFFTWLWQGALLCAVAAAAVRLGWMVIGAIISEESGGVTPEFAGAFWGAFFAFLFLLIGVAVRWIYGRWMSSYKALVKLQHILNDMMARIDDNKHILELSRKEFRRAGTDESVVMLSNRFIEVPVDPTAAHSLLNLDVINQLWQFFHDVRLLNDHLESANASHDRVQEACIARVISVETYNENLHSFDESMNEVDDRLGRLREDVNRLFATVRHCLSSKPLLARLMKMLARQRLRPKDERSIAGIVVELEREYEENRSRRTRWTRKMRDLMSDV